MSFILNMLLGLLEKELIKASPEAFDAIAKEIELIIDKLQEFVKEKMPGMAPVLDPALEAASTALEEAVKDTGEALVDHLKSN